MECPEGCPRQPPGSRPHTLALPVITSLSVIHQLRIGVASTWSRLKAILINLSSANGFGPPGRGGGDLLGLLRKRVFGRAVGARYLDRTGNFCFFFVYVNTSPLQAHADNGTSLAR